MSNSTPRRDSKTRSERSSGNEPSDQDPIDEYVSNNRGFLARVLTSRSTEARGYALAVITNGASVGDIEAIKEELDRIKDEIEE